ncbi:hypothetical protein F5144DRAFT_270114 [Chaetomium tenue]|uniref:Uncharacterized protein n=1 Tax=Chaetomium tenue TaxID=1854479 RepID=A0ACB7P081_9PEZI|nr:hypothetical protein F5144DRAFT_270114 [Chaetomium globosum]
MSTVPAPQPNPNDPGIGPVIYGVSWTFTMLALFTVCLRFYVRRASSRFFALEDWVMALALALQLVYQSILHIMCTYGLGKTGANITPDELLHTRRWMWISSPIANSVSIFARLSAMILLVKIFGTTHQWFKWFLIGFSTIMVILGIMSPIFLFAQVTPTSALWDVNVVGQYRFTPYVQYYTSFTLQLVFTITDLTYVLFPVCILWNLRMPTHQKIGLILVMSLSLITMGAALIKVVLVIIQLTNAPAVGHGNLAYFNGLYNLCTGVEQCLVIIMGCIPVLRSIAKLSFISTISSSFKRSKSSISSGYYFGHRNDSHDSNMTPRLRRSDDGEHSVRCDAGGGANQEGEYIQRVDGYSVTYGERVREKV